MNIPVFTRCLLRQSLISSALTHTCSKYYSFAGTSRLLLKTSPRKLLRIPPQASTPLLNVTQQKEGLIQHRNSGCGCSDEATIWDDLRQIKYSPVPALALGCAGLIPFVAPPVCMLFKCTFYPGMALAQAAYGACVLSFIGGVKWGSVLPDDCERKADWYNLGYSVAPPLVAWGALLLSPPICSLILMAGLGGTAYYETTLKGYPPWFKGMRLFLTGGALISLFTVLLFRYMLSPPNKPKRRLVQEPYQ